MSEIPAGGAVHVAAEAWSGRDDGPGPEHRRWWQAATPAVPGEPQQPGRRVSIVGFACDEGVRRNQGRVGAFEGPRAIRVAMGSLAFHHDVVVADRGDVVVTGTALEQGQALLGEVAGQAVTDGPTVVLGGGHETAYGTFCALRRAGVVGEGQRLGIINLDAHFDLRTADVPTSGTPFRQIATELGDDLRYLVVGISEPNNTPVLFAEARRIGATWVRDEDCTPERVAAAVEALLTDVDVAYLTVDLDVLPSAVAPGVSAPAALGVELRTILAAARQVAASGKLRVADVVELNPSLDVDGRTAKVAARIVDAVVGSWVATPPVAGDAPSASASAPGDGDPR